MSEFCNSIATLNTYHPNNLLDRWNKVIQIAAEQSWPISYEGPMWRYYNPVEIMFGAGSVSELPKLIGGRNYALVTYPSDPFQRLAQRVEEAAGPAAVVINDIAPNPDFQLLGQQCAQLAGIRHQIEVIVALGGGSVIDSAKVFAAADGSFDNVVTYLETGGGAANLGTIPIIAVPTTAGTGSEVTCWATVWDEQRARKYSLSRQNLYPEAAVIDPELMVNKPHELTLSTGLDTLSHALESIWNINANPISARHAVHAAGTILDTLPDLLNDLGNLSLRTQIADAALSAGLAFSNTKTAIAHNLSYPITLGWGIQHGIACSFTLPVILSSVDGIGGFRQAALHDVFGSNLSSASIELMTFLNRLGVSTRFADYGISDAQRMDIVDEAFAGERGRNFAGTKEAFLKTLDAQDGKKSKVA
ncbi:iron-containing alcohol dehydrogenase PsrA [Ruegeria lacuscaerulensis]|uniref:iron-containing alcohol dehydrogenase PsrA n=1 Tax=Ruegeria lacuscaerulensis TaxID=55218 RepID=UPI001BE3DB17|nr:iron-containing alcohol dehydrogenase PsrA [Ruegeria lacuscaerulensis]